MSVRGWLMIGPQSCARTGMLAPVGGVQYHHGRVPDASLYAEGAVIFWTAAPSMEPITLVCVEISIQPGRYVTE